jgi:hypothetical protein
MMNAEDCKNRINEFRINEDLDIIIKELKHYLTPVQRKIQNKIFKQKYPFGFIVGCPRSGSTLLLQWLSSLNFFSYPTNLLNRFAYAPYIGAQVQKMLFESKYDFSNEFSFVNSDFFFKSNLGKSKGILSVNEFQHFFRNYMNNFDPRFLNEDEIDNIDFLQIKKGLTSIEYAFDKPFVVKLFMLQFNLKTVFHFIPESIFFYIYRTPIFNMQSLLLSRKKYYGNLNIWSSVKPKEYDELKRMDIYHQIAGQVFFTNKAIEDALDNIPEQNKLIVQYEDFCVNPNKYYHCIREKYSMYGYNIPEKYNGTYSFQITNTLKLSGDEIQKLKNAYDYFLNQQ